MNCNDHAFLGADRATRLALSRRTFLRQSAAGIGLGMWAASTALMGAGLDNLADASVYAVSLYAVGRAAMVKVRAARLSGFLLIGLAVLLLVEVLRRFAGCAVIAGRM